MTLRRALELSRNLATANLLQGGIDFTPALEPRPHLRAGDGSADLSGMHALLPVRPGRAAGAADRSRGVLRRHRQRGRAPVAARDRVDRAGRQGDLPPSGGRLRRGSGRRTASPSTSSRRCCRASCSAAPPPASPGSRLMSPARPAPPTARTTPGSSASPTRSRWRCGSATTMPTAGAARWAAARPAAASRCRSSSRSSRRCGRTMRRARRCGGRRPRPGNSWSRPAVDADFDDGSARLYGRQWRTRYPRNAGRISAPRRARAAVDTQYQLVARGRSSIRTACRPRRLGTVRILLRRRPRRLPDPWGRPGQRHRRRRSGRMRRGRSRRRTNGRFGGGDQELMRSAWAWSRRPAGGAGAVRCGGGGAGLRARRDAVRHASCRSRNSSRGRSSFADKPGEDLVDPAVGFITLRGLGEGAARSQAAIPRASIPATPSRTSTSSSTAPSAAIASGCTCMWRRRASSSRGRRRRSSSRSSRRCRSPSGSIPPSSTSSRPPPTRPARASPGSSITSIRSGNGARAGRW